MRSVLVSDQQSVDAVPVDTEHLRRLAGFVLADRGVPATMEVSVLCVDRATMTTLNRSHMGGDGPTDVLAFPLDEPSVKDQDRPALLGDVVICPAVAAAQAAEATPATPVQAEMDTLVVHGLLHLLGHDHSDDQEAAAMFGLTDTLLAGFAAAGALP